MRTCQSLFIALFLLFFLFIPSSYAEYPQPEKPYVPPKPVSPVSVQLPQNLREQLKKEYSGFQVAGKKDYCSEFGKKVLPYSEANQWPWAYGLLKGDFNGDKLDDYSMIIHYKKTYQWIAAIRLSEKNNKPYQITFLAPPVIPEPGIDEPQKTGLKEKICDGVFSFTKENTLSTYLKGSQHFLNPFPAIGIVADGSAVYYYWKNGKWHRFGYTQ